MKQVCTNDYESDQNNLPVKHDDDKRYTGGIEVQPPNSPAQRMQSRNPSLKHTSEPKNVPVFCMPLFEYKFDYENVANLMRTAIAIAGLGCGLCTFLCVVTFCSPYKTQSTETLCQQSSSNNVSASNEANLNSLSPNEDQLNAFASRFETGTTNKSLHLLLLGIHKRVEALQQEVAMLNNKTLYLFTSMNPFETFENKLSEYLVNQEAKTAQILRAVLHLSSQTQTKTNQSSNLLANKLSQYVTLLYVSKKQADWVEAEQHCVAMGGHLVTVDSPSKAELVFQKAKSHNLTSHWIGLRANTTETVYLSCNTTRYWVATNKPTNYTDWQPNEPNGCDDGTSTQNINKAPENCVESALEKDSNKWNDAKCLSTQRSFICEINVEVEVPNNIS